MDNLQMVGGNRITMAVPSAAAFQSGDPVLFGRGTSPAFGLAGVVAADYTPPTGTAKGTVPVHFDGVYFLSVVGKDNIGGSNLAIAPGDKVYADGGTYDITTGVLYGFTLNGDATGGAYFGNALDAVTAGATTTIRVRLKQSGA